jgi:hypothetical protein
VWPALLLKKLPTAVHDVADAHDTARKTTCVAPAGFGVLCLAQLVPFHRSARLSVARLASAKLPTAVHEVGALHHTAFRIPLDVDGLGTTCIFQLAPSHPSASIFGCPVLRVKLPTAVHEEAVEQETPFTWLCCAPVGLGVVWTAQLVPVDRSANVESGTPKPRAKPPTAAHPAPATHDTAESCACIAPDCVAAVSSAQLVPFHLSTTGVVVSIGAPTAVHELEAAQDTPLNIGLPDAGLGVAWIVQLLPFHRSASVLLGNEFVVAYPPTAVHAVCDVHETPPRVASVAPDGSGVDWIDQLLPSHRSASTLLGKKPPVAVR